MSNDTAQINLKEPEQADWDTLSKGSSYAPPPPAEGPDGKPITYFGTVAEVKLADNDDNGYLNYQVDMKFVRSGSYDGRQIRTWVSTRPFMKKDAGGTLQPIKGNPNSLAKFLLAAGLQAKPQTNSEYSAAVKLVNGKAIGFTLDWEAKNKDTAETVRGFRRFPEDSERPGQRKTILKAGDVLNELDSKGNVIGTSTVQSEILFANARLKYFQNPVPTVKR